MSDYRPLVFALLTLLAMYAFTKSIQSDISNLSSNVANLEREMGNRQ